MLVSTTPAQVAQEANMRVDIPEQAPMLLGTFGTDSDKTALIRLPGGGVQTVTRGDHIGSRPVLAVEDGAILVAMAGDAIRLTMPGPSSDGFPQPRTPGSEAPPMRPGHMATQAPPIRPDRHTG